MTTNSTLKTKHAAVSTSGDSLSPITVGVSKTDHSIVARCPHCDKTHTVLLFDRRKSHEKTRETTASHYGASIGGWRRPRHRYFIADRRRHPDLTPARKQIYDAVLKSGDAGMLAKELELLGIARGSIHPTLSWLAHEGLIRYTVEQV